MERGEKGERLERRFEAGAPPLPPARPPMLPINRFGLRRYAPPSRDETGEAFQFHV